MLIPALTNINERTGGKIDPIAGNQKIYALNFIGFLIIYGYFAFGFADDDATCYANEHSDKRIEDDKETQHDVRVSWNFQFGFIQLWFLTVIQAVGLYLNHIYID